MIAMIGTSDRLYLHVMLAMQFWLDLVVLHVHDLGQLVVAGLQFAAAQPCELAVAGQQLALASQQLVCHTGLELVLR